MSNHPEVRKLLMAIPVYPKSISITKALAKVGIHDSKLNILNRLGSEVAICEDDDRTLSWISQKAKDEYRRHSLD